MLSGKGNNRAPWGKFCLVLFLYFSKSLFKALFQVISIVVSPNFWKNCVKFFVVMKFVFDLKFNHNYVNRFQIFVLMNDIKSIIEDEVSHAYVFLYNVFTCISALVVNL